MGVCGSATVLGQRRAVITPGMRVNELPSWVESRHIDDMVESSGLNSKEILATLFHLEMKGLVRRTPGNHSVRCC
jgi:predicted Rossmann fold nucleotide-binding protein DprA/Smf involved in DNA uptake